MRRSKHPVHPSVIAECAVIADMLELGRRDEITAFVALHRENEEPDTIIKQLVEIAMGEYLRRFPATRKMNNEPWHEDLLRGVDGGFGKNNDYTGECDYQCFFCRKSLNTMPSHRHPSNDSDFILNIRAHVEACGIRMIAGLQKPHKPLKRGTPGR